MTTRRIVGTLVIASVCSLCAPCGTAAADGQGTTVVTLTWVHIDPRSSSGPLTVTEIGGQPTDLPQAGTGVEVLSANTVLLSFERFWTDRVSTQLALGVPPTHRLRGTGTLEPSGVIGDGQQLSPALILKYNFGDPGDRWRPYVGFGVNYTWFRKSRITNDTFRQAFYGPNATTDVSVNSSWNPVYNAGVNWALDPRWSLGLSLAYTPLKARITVNAENTMFGAPVKVTTDVKMRTIATGVNVGYRF